jgi:hypothetical protein
MIQKVIRKGNKNNLKSKKAKQNINFLFVLSITKKNNYFIEK